MVSVAVAVWVPDVRADEVSVHVEVSLAVSEDDVWVSVAVCV